MTSRMPRTPAGLGYHGRLFWKHVLSEFALEDPQDLVLLSEACRCLDTVNEARKQLAEAGRYIKNRFGETKEHPAGDVERCGQRMLKGLLRELGLGVAAPGDEFGRPVKPLRAGPRKLRHA